MHICMDEVMALLYGLPVIGFVIMRVRIFIRAKRGN